jgi:S-adenosylmethionine decarboxylase
MTELRVKKGGHGRGRRALRAIAASRPRTAKAPARALRKVGGTDCTAAASRRSPEVGFLKGQGDLYKLKALGRHIVCELSGCQPSLLSDIHGIAAMMIAAAKAAGATIMESAFHRFEPQGVSGTVILAESHLSIHTWPEKAYAAMDFYTCGDHTDPWAACDFAAATLRAKSVLATELKRGIEKSDGEFTHVLNSNQDARVLTA